MNADITINDPIINPPEYFLVRYRLLPNGVFIDLGVQDNDQFTIPGLSAGDYELEVRFVNEEGVICPAVLTPFTVTEEPPPDECVCLVVDEAYVTRKCNNTCEIHLSFSNLGNAVCTYRITYTEFNNQNPQIVLYPGNTMPSVLDIPIPYSASALGPSVIIEAICCTGLTDYCYQDNISDIREEDCGCDPPVVSDAWINFDPVTLQYSITIVIEPPPVGGPGPFTINWLQQVTPPPVPDSGSTVVLAPGTHTFNIDPF